MPCFQHAKQNCPKKADECQHSHDRAVIKVYLDAQHAKVTSSKKAIHDKTKATFKALKSLLAFVPPKFIPTLNLVQFPLVQVIVPLFRPSPTLPPFPFTIPMILPIIMMIS